MDDIKKKKMAGAIGSAIVVIIYYAFFFGIIMKSVESMFFKLLLGFVPAALIIAVAVVCIQRIKEIKGGEEDDLSKY